jgi:hypothetical protein
MPEDNSAISIYSELHLSVDCIYTIPQILIFVKGICHLGSELLATDVQSEWQ